MNEEVIVTGASGGIGSAVVRQLHGSGYNVVGIDVAPPCQGLEISSFLQVDLNVPEDVQSACKALCTGERPLWALVHCAGLYPIRTVDDYSLELWDEVHNVNVRSAFQLVKAIYPRIVRGGRVVLVASGAAHIGSRDVAYSASKAGLLGLVRSLAKTLARCEILVNGICPGVIKTAMSERMAPEETQNYIARIPLGRLGTIDEVAVCALFLLDKHNSYMTGATIDVNGGLYAR